MSQELEMLRSMVAVDHLRGGEKFEVPKTAGQASWVWRMTHLDLCAILARLEAAERVCEKSDVLRKATDAADAMWDIPPSETNVHGDLYVAQNEFLDALRAYRALDTKEPT